MKKTTLIPLAVSTTALLAFASSALAQDDTPQRPRMHRPAYEDVDTNGDKGVTFEEFLAAQEKRIKHLFDRLDADKDGIVTKEEWDAAKPGKMGPKKDKPEPDQTPAE